MKRNLLVLVLLIIGFIPCFGDADTRTATVYEKVDMTFIFNFMKSQKYFVKKISDSILHWSFDGLSCYVIVPNGKGKTDFIGIACTYNLIPKDRLVTTLKTVNLCNDYNAKYKFGKIIFEDDLIGLKYDLSLEGGITEARLLDFFETATRLISAWQKEVLEKI